MDLCLGPEPDDVTGVFVLISAVPSAPPQNITLEVVLSRVSFHFSSFVQFCTLGWGSSTPRPAGSLVQVTGFLGDRGCLGHPCRGLWENLAADSAIKRNWLAPKVRFGAFCWRTWRWHWSCLIIYWSKWWMCVSVCVLWPKYNLMLTSVRYSSDSAAQFLIENTSLFSWTVAKMRLFYKPMILKRLKRRSDAKFVRVWSCYSNLITGSLIDLGLNTVLQWFFWSLHIFDVTNQPSQRGFLPADVSQ